MSTPQLDHARAEGRNIEPGLACSPQWITSAGEPLAALPVRSPVRRPFEYLRMMDRLPAAVRVTLTPMQLDAISDALVPEPKRHVIDYRISLPLFGRRYYLTILAGPERRSVDRLAREAQVRARRTATFYAVALVIAACVAFVALVVAGYVAKSALGVDVLDGPSMLHQFVFTGRPPN